MKKAFLILSFIYMNSINGEKFLGPGIANLQRIEKCGKDMLGYSLNMTIQRLNRTHQAIDFHATSPFSFEGVHMNGTISKWGDGGWKPHIHDFYDELCSHFRKYAYDSLMDILRRMKKPAVCPMDKGNYDLKNYVFDGQLKSPVMYGEFKIDMMIQKSNVTVTCLTLYVKVDPKIHGTPNFG